MADKTLTGSIALTKLIYANYKSSKGADCLMIPIDANKLEKDGKGGVYLPVRILVNEQQDQHGQNGMIIKSIGTNDYKALDDGLKEKLKDHKTDEAKQLVPILGNVKDWSNTGGNATSGAASTDVHQASADGVADDLPF